MTILLPGLLRAILQGRLARDQRFALLLAERLPRPTDPIDHLLATAGRGAPEPEAAFDPVLLETLGLNPDVNATADGEPPLRLALP